MFTIKDSPTRTRPQDANEGQIRAAVKGCNGEDEVKKKLLAVFTGAIISKVDQVSPAQWHIVMLNYRHGDRYDLICTI